MESLLVSTGAIAFAEIGDKTQLLAIILAAHFKRPIPLILGILFATLINHSLAAAAGIWLASTINHTTLRWILAGSFIAMAIWAFIPDKLEENQPMIKGKMGVFWVTFFTFFLVEMGDKTQLATIAFTAHYATPFMVVMGTTLGMLIADVPAIMLVSKTTNKLSLKLVRSISAVFFIFMGIVTLLNVNRFFS
ncbi:TMEM165/GDT1 family protein [Legionella sp. 29fVS95]|uniref:TMEM165/GDT1 family protein n=1 Tax=Legionella sp. 29fVS95 TaxID=3402813 RepID=UPI003AF57825